MYYYRDKGNWANYTYALDFIILIKILSIEKKKENELLYQYRYRCNFSSKCFLSFFLSFFFRELFTSNLNVAKLDTLFGNGEKNEESNISE